MLMRCSGRDGELLKLGIDIAQSTVAKYMPRRRGPPSQGWRAFLRNPWDEAPRYLILDRDTSYGAAVTRRLRAMGIRDRPIAPRWPWQNGHVERLIGSIRRECVNAGEKGSRRAGVKGNRLVVGVS